ncbi:copper amine oxidase N-terminal domain-containing protein [Paenibacillus donghaensis]|uniref:copper amine oxidase N-terminal domain-containing protein n=1 Tax=Paenibacillus donghaensis TaxID=414771 RepID=UPI001883A434|nr:copper amine oxidase N-terminal domain-containing protein [Paenibacillus donghaensis]MBE9916253.1 copper amine oxidase N-terminal domain-containing protein [Paenibacillus donghaensis]
MKKLWVTLVAVLMVVTLSLQPAQVEGAAASKRISVFVDGVKLNPVQAPTMIKGRTMLPMRVIFEALGATVQWSAQTKTVTAYSNDTTVVLKVGSKTASVNNRNVSLDAPAQILNGATMVPVRFVSETLGAQVDWNGLSQVVTITTSNRNPNPNPNPNPYPPSSGNVSAVSYVNAQIVGRNGDGRDVQINFAKAYNESDVKEYRVLIVKSSSYGFTTSQALSNAYYTSAWPTGRDQNVNLTSQSKDVNGDLLRNNQSYNAYVLTLGKNGSNALSNMSSSFTLSTSVSANAPSNVKANDINDYGDGRDLQVSFDQPVNTNNVQNYRIFVVKNRDVGSFNLNTANSVSSSNYTTVSKTSYRSITTTLSSTTRDTSGEYIKNGIAYNVFVLAVGNSYSASELSAPSSTITLSSGAISAPVITRVEDVNNYGDGRDLMVRFDRSSDESRIGSYRIFVVKDYKASSFDLSTAKNVSSSYYTSVSKTGYNINQTLSYGARDVDGDYIRNGVSYRVFVMAVGTGSYSGSYALSGSSSSIVLYNGVGNGNGNGNGNGSYVYAATNVSASDVSDYGDGRDMKVSFTRASDESNLYGYRIMVVKSGDANYFTLSKANALSSYYYTDVNKTGYNISQTLSDRARDVNGDLIRNGVSYRVFVLSVGAYGNNALSSYPPEITLSNNSSVDKASGVSVSVGSCNGESCDLDVSFTRAGNESNISGYRIMVVKDKDVNNFGLSEANRVSSSYYTRTGKDGYTITRKLSAGTKDVNGDTIKRGESYRVFVLSEGAYGTNALSTNPPKVTLPGTEVAQVTNLELSLISNNGDGSDLKVSFDKLNDESILSEYRIIVVKSNKDISLNTAIGVPDIAYTPVKGMGKNIIQPLTKDTKDYIGTSIIAGESYKVYVLSVGKNGKYALSAASLAIKVPDKKVEPVGAAKNVLAVEENDGKNISVTFTKADKEDNIKQYRIIVTSENLNLENAKSANSSKSLDKGSNYKVSLELKDSKGNPLQKGTKYNIYVLSVGSNNDYALSESANITLKPDPVDPEPKAVTKLDAGYASDNSGNIQLSFERTADDKGAAKYRIFLVDTKVKQTFTKTDALKTGVKYTEASLADGEKAFNKSLKDLKDTEGYPVSKNKSYTAYVLTAGKDTSEKNNALSGPANLIDKTAPQNIVASWNNDKLVVKFDKAPDDSKITGYAVLAAPNTMGDTEVKNYFDKLDDSAKMIQAKGQQSYEFKFEEPNNKDVKNDSLKTNGQYNVYIVSVVGDTNVWSDPVALNPVGAKTLKANK